MTAAFTVLVVGATGSVGRLVVAEAMAAGFSTRALVRDEAKARQVLPAGAEIIVGDVTQPATLAAAVDGVDAVVLTLGADGGGAAGAETVSYGGVRNVLAAIGDRTVRIALMTAIGVTDRVGAYNRSTQSHDWKRRSERLLRVSGHPYTIVRPGWFDYNTPAQHQLTLLQGDTRHAGNPSDGVIARRQIGQVLVDCLTTPAAVGKTFELVAEDGAGQTDLGPLFAALDADSADSPDAVHDQANMPLDDEPQRVRDDLEKMRRADSGQPGVGIGRPTAS